MMNGLGCMGGFGGYGAWFGWIFWIVIIGVIIWAVIRLTGTSRESGSNLPAKEDALDILKKRYAQGEISKEEFEERKKVLLG